MLKNVKIGKKLIIMFILVAVISSISGVAGIFVMQNMNSGYQKALVNYGFAQGKVGVFNTEFNNSRAILRDIVIQTDDAGMQSSKKKLDDSNTKINQYFADMESVMTSDQEKSYYNDIKSELSNFLNYEKQIEDLALKNNNTEAFQMMSTQASPLSDKIRENADALMQSKTSAGDQVMQQLQQQETTVNVAIYIVIIISFVVSILIAIYIARSIAKPVKQMADAAERMAQGDLKVKVDIHSTNEIGQLAASFSKSISAINAYIDDISTQFAKVEQGDLTVKASMEYKGDFVQLRKSIGGILNSLNDTLNQINQSAEQVSVGADQVSGGAQGLAQGATEQASSIEELTASISDISDKVNQNTQNIDMGMRYINKAAESTETSNQQMQKMLTSMNDISTSSNEIGKIIKVIDDIAFQTNILALNAAVEAARAGEAGKGFAVVADEVRNLASKSANAAKQTTELIESSINSVKEGSVIANETAKSLKDAVENSQLVVETMKKVDRASNDQANAIAQVTQGVEQISNVVQTNSATAEESAAASEELSGQAKILQSLTGRFKLRGTNFSAQTDSLTENVQM